MDNLNSIEQIINSIEENQEYIMLKDGYNIKEEDLQKITTAIKQEATELDNMGIIIQYEIWEIIIIDAIDRYMTRRYSVKTGKEIHKPEIYATECVRKSIADSTPVDIPNIEYAHNNQNNTYTRKYYRED